MSRLLGPQGRNAYTFQQKNMFGDVVRQWHDKALNLKAKEVCKACNAGWMSDLENEAKPAMKEMILHGGKATLFPKDVASIAAFSFKTAVVANHMRPIPEMFFTLSERRRFAATLELPTGVQIWLGRMSHRRSGFIKSSFSRTPLPVKSGFKLYPPTPHPPQSLESSA